MTRPPDTGGEIVLRDQTGGAFRGELDDLRGAFITVRLFEDRARPFTQLEKMLVTWADGPGVNFLPVQLVDSPGPATWIAEIVGEPWQEQRRQYLRAALSGTVSLSPAHPSAVQDIQTTEGSLVDLSEAGLRCAVGSRWPYLTTPTTPVTVRITVDELSFTLAAKVLYGRPMGRHDGTLEVVVVFDRPVPQAELLAELTRRAGAR